MHVLLHSWLSNIESEVTASHERSAYSKTRGHLEWLAHIAPSLAYKLRGYSSISSSSTSSHHLSTYLLRTPQAHVMDRGSTRALSPSAVALAKKQKLDGDANDIRIMQEAMARILARHRSETERDEMSVSRSAIEKVLLTMSYSYKSNAINSPLLRLPGEIRNMIFGWVFRGVEYGLANGYWPYDEVVRMQIDNQSGRHTFRDFNLLRVCRQVHAETALLPYSLGSFDIPGVDQSLCYYERLQALEGFMKRRTEEQIDAISRLTFDGSRDDESEVPELMEETGAFWVANLAEAENRELLSRLHASLTV